MQEEIRRFANGEFADDDDEELTKLVLENSKLKHRLAILNRVSRVTNYIIYI